MPTAPNTPSTPTFGGFSLTPSPTKTNTNNTNTQSIDESTPFIAASDGNLQLLQQSIQHLSITNIHTHADTNGLTLLHSASSYNQIEIMRWLLRAVNNNNSGNVNVNVNAKDNDGDTPLHHCDNIEAVKVLIEEGNADYTIQNEEGNTVLEMKEEELREYYMSNQQGGWEGTDGVKGGDCDSDSDEDVENLKKIVEYLRKLVGKTSTGTGTSNDLGVIGEDDEIMQ
jgi:hypothetical protein